MRTRQKRVATDTGDPWGVEQPTETLEQKKTNSWTPVGQATDKNAPAPTN